MNMYDIFGLDITSNLLNRDEIFLQLLRLSY